MSRALTKGELIQLLEQAPSSEVRFSDSLKTTFSVVAIQDPVYGSFSGPRVFMLETRWVNDERTYQQISTIENEQEFAYRDNVSGPWLFDVGAKEKHVQLSQPVCFTKVIRNKEGCRTGFRFVDTEGNHHRKPFDPVITACIYSSRDIFARELVV